MKGKEGSVYLWSCFISGFYQEEEDESRVRFWRDVYRVVVPPDYVLGPPVAAARSQPGWKCRCVSSAAACGRGDLRLLSAACDLV